MTNKYDSIDFCTNILYDYVYNRNKTNKCYIVKYIQKSNIQLINIKKNDNYDYNNVLKHTKTSPVKVKYVGKNKGRYIFKKYSKTGFPTMLRVGIYDLDKNTNINDMHRSELVNMTMSYILSELVITNNFKFILLPIMNFDITYNKLKKIAPNIAKEIKNENTNTKAKVETIKNDTMMYIQILENYHKMGTMKNYIDKFSATLTIKHWKVLIFQILYGLYVISKRYPSFRHNSLDLESIYICQKKDSNDSTIVNVGEKIFKIPNMGFDIKITNFDNSNIKNIVENRNTTLKDDNLYYDIHYVLHYIINDVKNKPTELVSFLDKVLPIKYRNTKNEKFSGLDEAYYRHTADEYLTPMLILTKNNFFSQFITKNKMDINDSPLSNSPEDIKTYNIKENDIDYSISTSITNDTDDPLLLGKKYKVRISEHSEPSKARFPSAMPGKLNIKKNNQNKLKSKGNNKNI